MSRQALGRGLRALIGGPEESGAERREGLIQLGVGEIEPNPFQPRRHISQELLQGLAQSIRAHGVLEPVVVRPASREGGARYELVIGERRWRAAQLAGLESVPALVRPISDREMVQMALVENLQREDLNPLEEAEAYRRLIDEFGMNQEELARLLGRARPTVANALRLLELEEPIKTYVADGRLSAGHAKALLGMPAGAARVQLARRVVERGLSVRQTEELVREWGRAKAPSTRAGPGAIRPWTEVEAALEKALGTRVVIREGRRGGRIGIAFYGREELLRLLELLSRLDGEVEG